MLLCLPEKDWRERYDDAGFHALLSVLACDWRTVIPVPVVMCRRNAVTDDPQWLHCLGKACSLYCFLDAWCPRCDVARSHGKHSLTLRRPKLARMSEVM